VATSTDSGATLGRIQSIKVPSLKEDEAYTVHKVDAVTMMLNGSMIARTATGLDVLLPGSDRGLGNRTVGNRSQTPQVPGRKLLYNIYRTENPYTFSDEVLATVTYENLLGFWITQGPTFGYPDQYDEDTSISYDMYYVPDSYTIADVKQFFADPEKVGTSPLTRPLCS
jgi:hypothetical protein